MDFYFSNGLAPSTQKTYGSGKKRYITFCTELGLSPVPASEQQLCRFAAKLAEEGLAPGTIKSYLSAIRHLHLQLRLADPKIADMPRLEQVVKGAKSQFVKRNPQCHIRLPITPDLLLKMKSTWEKAADSFDGMMLWAAVCLCYFGFLRSGEITVPSEKEYDPGAHLNFSDVSTDSRVNPSLVCVRIKVSKMDPFRKGVDIYLGRTNSALCPVSAVLAYMARRGDSPGPLFQFKDKCFLTCDRFVQQVKKALTEAGVNCKGYSGHSFRIGAASVAASRGIPESTIKALGRWESAAYLLYIRISRERLANISKLIS